MAFTVKLVHEVFGKVELKNITEIHFNYPRPLPHIGGIAFESDIDETGQVYDIEDVMEFEAIMAEAPAETVAP